MIQEGRECTQRDCVEMGGSEGDMDCTHLLRRTLVESSRHTVVYQTQQHPPLGHFHLCVGQAEL